MTILLVTFVFMFGACLISFNISKSRKIASKLDDEMMFFTNSDGNYIIEKSVYAVVTKDAQDVYSIKNISFDPQVFTEESALAFVFDACKKQVEYGNIENYYFKLYSSPFPYNAYTLISSDMSEQIISYQNELLNAGLILIVVYLLLFLLVYGASFRIIQPLKDTLTRQRQFISNASHELKTPITVISANTDVLMVSEKNKWLDNIKSQTKRMEDLVADMLMLARLDEGVPLEITDFNLSEEVFGAVLPFEALAFEKGKFIETDVATDISYHGDKQSIKQILSILIDNAIKYSIDGGKIIISLKKENHPVIKVFNEGSEIQEYESDKIFNRFYRGDNSRNRSSGGSGLGLAIAKGIADTNKWKISAHSKYKESMCITITL